MFQLKELLITSFIIIQSGCLVTAGEGGVINIWQQIESIPKQKNIGHTSPGKFVTAKNRDRNYRIKPY